MINLMTDKQPETLYIQDMPLFYNENDLDKTIRNLSQAHKEFIDRIDSINIFFCENNSMSAFASALFKHGKLVMSGFNVNRITGEACKERITNNLAEILEINIPGFDVRTFVHKSLCQYFNDRDTTNKEIKKSEYKRHKPFITVLLELESALKSKTFDTGCDGVIKNINGLSALTNPCDFGSDINKATLKSSIGANILPFHKAVISYDVINKALDELSKDNQIALQVFYFSGMYSEYQDEINKLDKYKKSSRTRYQKVLRAKNRALDNLIDSICNIQYLDREVCNG